MVAELDNGTLDASGETALRVLAVGYIVVTQVNTVLWPAFSATPLLDSSRASLVYHDGDAYVFAWVAA